jgi:tyrosyl-tRNA synthetase
MASKGIKPNIAIILGILPGTDGVIRMSKSLGNHIPIHTTAEDMYGKVMSVPDIAMPSFFRLVTRWTPPEIEGMEKGIERGELHPRDAKMKLAYEVVSLFYGDDDAITAQAAFVRLFQKGDVPAEMPEYHLKVGETVLDVLVSTGLVSSKSEGRRMLQQKGVRLDGEVLAEPGILFPHPGVLQVGKRHFIRIKE